MRSPCAGRHRFRAACCAASVLLVATASAPCLAAGPAFDYRTRVGLVAVLPQGICLSIGNPDLRPESVLDLVGVPPEGFVGRPRLMRARIDQRFDECPGFPEGSTLPRYILKLTEGTLSVGEVAVAIDRPPGDWKTASKAVTVDLDGDGTAESFRACAVDGGLHLTIWSGEPGKGTRRWHRYHPVDHELEDGCTEADTREGP